MGKHKKNREYSSDSESGSDSEPIEKKKKHKKSSKNSKKQKSKKKKRQNSSSSESGSESDTWVENNVDKKKSRSPSPAKTAQREDWMSADNFFLPTFSKEKKDKKTASEKANLATYDPATSSRELNPYYKTGEGGLPSFQRPKDSDDYGNYRSTSRKNVPSSSSGGWRKSKKEENPQRRSRSRSRSSSSSRSRSRSESPVQKPRVMLPARPDPAELEGITASHSDFLTDQQMNEIGAKMIRAELMGNETLAQKLKGKLDRAKAFKSSGKAPPASKEKEKVVLSITNAAGTSRPVTQREESKKRPQDKKKKNKRVETHEDGERTKYYPDDGKYDIKQMVRFEINLFFTFFKYLFPV